MALPEYNFKYLMNLCNLDEKNYELNKIMNTVDQAVSGKAAQQNQFLFHMVPIVFFTTIVSGFSVYIYKMINV